ncbi:MAG: DsbA family oxidoreductase [bacterium]
MNKTDPKHVDLAIICDVSCPWCLVAFKDLRNTLIELEDAYSINVSWLPFELNPTMSLEGELMLLRNSRRYGSPRSDLAGQKASMIAIGKKHGIAFDYFDEMKVYNTLSAHQLIYWAGNFRKQTELAIAIMEAYFSHRENISDTHVLEDIAVSVGLPKGKCREVLNTQCFQQEVRELQARWRSLRISSVPTFLIGDQYLVPGSADPNTLASAIREFIGCPTPTE